MGIEPEGFYPTDLSKSQFFVFSFLRIAPFHKHAENVRFE
jgi:hypothetical protein